MVSVPIFRSALLVAGIILALSGPAESAGTPAQDDILTCAKDIAGANATIEALSLAEGLCYRTLFNQARLHEYYVRRVLYEEQPIMDNVLLWMVVAITMGGVFLSGAQL